MVLTPDSPAFLLPNGSLVKFLIVFTDNHYRTKKHFIQGVPIKYFRPMKAKISNIFVPQICIRFVPTNVIILKIDLLVFV